MKEYELKYFVGDMEIEACHATLMLASKGAVVVDETKHGGTIHVQLVPQVH